MRSSRRATAEVLRRLTWWQALLVLGGVALAVVGIVLLVGRLAGFTGIVDAARHAELWWIGVAAVAEAFEIVGYVIVFRAIVRFDSGPALGLWLSTRTVFASIGATRLFSTAGIGGLAVVYWALRKTGLPRHPAVVRTLAIQIAVFGAFGVAVVAAAVARLAGLGDSAPAWMAWGWLAVAVPASVLGFALSGKRPRAALARPGRAARLRGALATPLEAIALIRSMSARHRAGRDALAGVALYWIADIAGLWAGLAAFGVEISLPALVLAYATGYVSIVLPLPAGGVGGVDAAMTAALVAVGVPVGPALLGVLVYRFCSFVLPTVPALAAASTLPLLGRELRRVGLQPRMPS